MAVSPQSSPAMHLNKPISCANQPEPNSVKPAAKDAVFTVPYPNFNLSSEGFTRVPLCTTNDCLGQTETSPSYKFPSWEVVCEFELQSRAVQSAWIKLKKQWPIAKTFPDQQRSKSDNPSLWSWPPPPPNTTTIKQGIQRNHPQPPLQIIVHSSLRFRIQVHTFETLGM